ncbi:hypothetical protein [Mycobacterium hubeiense]|uniref:hypothetical protein n=1 Tax=Mycobacterium hubeiense TaxID=1867256 RepID=UPI001158E681|nr:hypothetical protein [Mycobacterium sp. QGD 101]
MQSPHAMLRWLVAERRRLERTIGHRPIGAAACEVFDELIRRTRVIADAVPVDAAMTLDLINRHFGDLADTLMLISTTLRTMADLTQEGADAVEERRQPFLRFVARVESEGYAVADNLAVTDTADWPTLEESGDADVRVQLAAERIARAEQALIHQQRIERMAAGVAGIENAYAQRIRDLIV